MNATESGPLQSIEEFGVESVRWGFRFARQQLAVLLLALALGSSLAWISGSPQPWYWCSYFLVLTAAAALSYRAYRRDQDLTGSISHWRLMTLGFAAAGGLGWGAAALFLYDLAPPHGAVAVTAVTIAVAFASVLLFAHSLSAQLAFVVPAMAPLLIRLAQTDPIGIVTSASLVVALSVTVTATAFRNGVLPQFLKFKLDYQDARRALITSREGLVQAQSGRDKFKAERDAVKTELADLRRQAEEASVAKDEFLATMSHEIRTPLNGILPILDLMRRTDLDEEQHGLMKTIFVSSRHLLSIIDDMLDYSKIQAGKLELESVGINLAQVIDSVTTLLSGNAKRKGLTLETRIDPSVRLAIRGDPVRLRQIITNLVGNAIKFTESGGVEVTVSNKGESRTEYELLFTVRDTGIGMDEAAQRKLFEPFSQADASTTRNFGGSGLGLVICKRLVKLMSGEIGVKSQPGRGSEFWFTCWVKKAVGDIDPEARRLAGVRMLVVSGEEAFMQRARRFANRNGCNLDLAVGLKPAVEAIQKAHREGGRWKIDVVAFDAASLGGKVLALARKLATHSKLKLPCLLLTPSGELPPVLKEVKHLAAVARNESDTALCEKIGALLPAAVEPDVSPDHDRADGHGEDTDDEPIRAKVLLAEDNHINLHVAKKLMDSLGVEYAIVENGKDALETLKSKQFDAVLMDCMMPIMDGYTATRKRRAFERENGLKPVPIVAMTANAMAGDKEKCLDAGMDFYMSKPLDRRQVAQILRRVTGASEGDADAPLMPPRRTAPAAGGDLDHSVLKALSRLMGDELHELIRSYIAESPGLIEKIDRAARWGNHRQLADLAHELKSTSVSLGAIQVGHLAQTIEMAARANELDKVTETVVAVPAAFDRAAKALREFSAAAAA